MGWELLEPWKVFQQRNVMKERTLPPPPLCGIFLLIKMRGFLEKVEFQTVHSGMWYDTIHSWKDVPLVHDDVTQDEALPGVVY